MSKIALGTWAWGAGAFGGDAVFGSKTDVENLKPVFDAAMKAGLNLWDTATVYGMGESEKILGTFVAGEKRETVDASVRGADQRDDSHRPEIWCLVLSDWYRMGHRQGNATHHRSHEGASRRRGCRGCQDSTDC